jgi:two-component system response regulator NreC
MLVDDHQIIRQGLRSLINRQQTMEVVAEAEDGRQAVRLAVEHSPDVIVMDVTMPNLNGIEATRQILRGNPNARVIALSMHADEEFVSRMLEAGARGYMLKDCAFEELVGAIQTVLTNGRFLSARLARPAAGIRAPMPTAEALAGMSRLTPREREVLQLLAEGRSTKHTAAELGVSIKTIETHRHNIMEKLDIRTIAELTKYAIRQGFTGID